MKIETKDSLISGTGVFTTQPVRRGEVVLVIDDSRIVDADNPLREGEKKYHCDWLPDGKTVLMQPPECYINHSCEPNVFVYSVNKQRFVLALTDLIQGEEVVYDYAINAADSSVWTCTCGSARCRGRHKSAFFELPESLQREYLPLLDPWFAQVHKDRIENLLRRSAAHE
jgi:hypothetical protein